MEVDGPTDNMMQFSQVRMEEELSLAASGVFEVHGTEWIYEVEDLEEEVAGVLKEGGDETCLGGKKQGLDAGANSTGVSGRY